MGQITNPSLPILIVDDDPAALDSMQAVMNTCGMQNTRCFSNGREALEYAETVELGIVMLDLRIPDISGEDILDAIRNQSSDVPVVVVTAANEIETAVRCMKKGAFDFLVKPVDAEHLAMVARRALSYRELAWENRALKASFLSSAPLSAGALEDIVTQDPKMFAILRYARAVAVTSQPILITGETGVGKGLLARAIHEMSGRSGPFVIANVAGIDDVFFADTLFGHRKGSFTGAIESRHGLVEKAGNGTLFLDEIGDLSGVSQVKLLRLVEDREYYPVGSDVTRRSNARYVIATSRDLDELIKQGTFRKELYYRLSTHRIHLPALRDRKGDLPLLVDHFLSIAAHDLGKKKPAVSAELTTLLELYGFPGNVRELQSLVFDALSRHSRGVLSSERFREQLSARASSITQGPVGPISGERVRFRGIHGLPTIKEAEALLVAEAMEQANNNQAIAARLLGISRQALNQRLKRAKARQDPNHCGTLGSNRITGNDPSGHATRTDP